MNERIIHNGEILTPIEGVKDEPLPEPKPASVKGAPPLLLEDIEPEELARIISRCISEALEEQPRPTPSEITTRLLQLKTAKNHKVLWTRFDISQLFAIYSNKLDAQRRTR